MLKKQKVKKLNKKKIGNSLFQLLVKKEVKAQHIKAYN